MPSAEIITIGTEILLGEIVDTNTRYIARHLRNLGIDLYRTITIGDNVERIAAAIKASMERADIVITTGGLGPTVDDPTREAVARAAGVPLEYREELWQQIVAVVGRYGRTPSENNRRQAYVPQGSIAIPNPVGTAPSFIVERPSPFAPLPKLGEGLGVRVIISFPGVPKEMEYLFHASAVPYLQRRFDLHHVIKVRLVHTSGIGESRIDEIIGDLETLSNPTVGLAAHSGIVDVRIAAKADSEAEADRLIAEVEADVRQRLGKAIFGIDEDTLEGVTLRNCGCRGWSLVTVEAGLDGMLVRRLSSATQPEFKGGESLPITEAGRLSGALRERMQAEGASAGLGVAGDSERRTVHILMITPDGEQSRDLTYGGPHANVPRWASNLALDWLRLAAGETA
ncbi:MAG: CinA family nicotinamide mononucleotide deamidase-related protein [Chloroflexota bacterium]